MLQRNISADKEEDNQEEGEKEQNRNTEKREGEL